MAPPSFRPHVFEFSFVTPHPRAEVWAWLNDPRTFTKQVWPWRVEFVDRSGAEGASGFTIGVRNVHHGPLMVFAGEIGAVDPPRYRDLVYDYGSHALSLRLIRPTRLQFWLDDANRRPSHAEAEASPTGEPATRVRLRVDSLTKPWIAGLWTLAQRAIWTLFPRWCRREVARRRRRAEDTSAATDPTGEHAPPHPAPPRHEATDA